MISSGSASSSLDSSLMTTARTRDECFESRVTTSSTRSIALPSELTDESLFFAVSRDHPNSSPQGALPEKEGIRGGKQEEGRVQGCGTRREVRNRHRSREVHPARREPSRLHYCRRFQEGGYREEGRVVGRLAQQGFRSLIPLYLFVILPISSSYDLPLP